MAFILIKTGRNIDGLVMLCDIFNEKCDELFYYLTNYKKVNKKEKENIQS
jgi:hypothetical protein